MQPSAVISRLPVTSTDVPTISKPKSLLEQLETAYSNFLDARRISYRLDVRFPPFCLQRSMNVQENRAPQFCNYKTLNEVYVIEIDLIGRHILSFFRNQMGEDNEYNQVLLSNFMIPFMLFEGSFRSCRESLHVLLLHVRHFQQHFRY